MNDLSIFICAHNRILNKLPERGDYIIAAQNERVDNNEFPLMLMQDSFTEDHKIGYGECCQIRHLYKNPEKIGQYVGFCHYRRFFSDFINNTDNVINIIREHGAIYAKPWTANIPNFLIMQIQHMNIYQDLLHDSINTLYPEYNDILQQFFNDRYCCYCNMFIMSKDDFLNGAEFVFNILDMIDQTLGVKSDSDVRKYMLRISKSRHWTEKNIKWQVRIQGFISEYLWDIYRRIKFPNAYFSPLSVLGDRDMSYQSEEQILKGSL